MLRIVVLGLLCLPFLATSQSTNDSLRIAVYDSPPFGMLTNTGEIGGLMVELWEDIAEELELPYNYELTDMDGLISGLRSKQYDVGLGAISITPKRERQVDFSHAINPSGTGIAVSRQSASSSFFTKWGPILMDLLELIGGLLLMLFLSALIVYFTERKYAQGEKTERTIDSISDGLWWSAVTMTTVGYGDKVPRSRAGKILGIIWIFTSIIFFSLFTANASAKLTNSKIYSKINTVDDLRRVKVVAVAKSSGEEFLIRENIRYQIKEDIESAFRAVLDGEADAIVSNIPVLKYHNKTDHGGEFLISDQYLLRNNMGIALQEGSHLKEQVNLILLEKISEAKWQHAVYKYLGD